MIDALLIQYSRPITALTEWANARKGMMQPKNCVRHHAESGNNDWWSGEKDHLPWLGLKGREHDYVFCHCLSSDNMRKENCTMVRMINAVDD